MSRLPNPITSLAVLLLAGFALAFGVWKLGGARSWQTFGTLVSRVECAKPLVALTFDDGPTPAVLPLLDHLRAGGVEATFFVVGAEVAKNPQLARRIAAEGHELGNHSYSHRRMLFKSWSFIDREIQRTDELIRASGHSGTIHFRPPYGKKLVLLPYYLARNQRTAITWDVEPESHPELAGNAERIAAHVVEKVRPGSIVLLHPMFASGRPSREAVAKIIAGLGARGFSFVSVSRLLRECEAARPDKS